MIPFFQWLQATPWSTWLRESTWGYPLLAAIHVVGIAWFGGAVLKNLPAGKRMGLAFMTVTGLILFYMAPVHCYQSIAFRAKMLFLAVAWAQTTLFAQADVDKGGGPRSVTLACWVGMIFAARGIAFF